jgi:hypothetical protein
MWLAVARKKYPYKPLILYNLANDIVEMYKAKITLEDGERFGFNTDMYGKKTEYMFRMTKQPDGCLLSIATDGEDEKAARRLSFMFSIVDNMLAPLVENGYAI